MVVSGLPRWLAVVAASLLVVTACRKKDDTPDDLVVADDPLAMAEDGSDANTVETNGQLLTSTLVATSTSGSLSVASASDLGFGDLRTQEVGDGTKALYFPRGCVDVVHDATTKTATYTFAGCTGPSGLARVRGTVRATYAAEGGVLVLDLTADDLQISGATLDVHARAEITAEGVARTMRWKAEIAGQTARGRELTRTSDKTLKWTVGERCLAVEGTSEGKIRSRNLRTVVSDYRRCQRGCPEDGGVITTTNLDSGKVVEIRFDGTDEATFVGPNGTETALPLLCSG